jgi:hypothetical protein
LEVRSALAAGLEAQAPELGCDVFGRLEVADRAGLAAAHGIVRKEEETAAQVTCRDLPGGGRGRRLRGGRPRNAREHCDGERDAHGGSSILRVRLPYVAGPRSGSAAGGADYAVERAAAMRAIVTAVARPRARA